MCLLPLPPFTFATQDFTIFLIPLLSRWPWVPYPEKIIKRFSKGNCLGCPHRAAAPSSMNTSSPQHFSHRCISLGYSWTPSDTLLPKPLSSWFFLCCSCPHGLFTLTSRAFTKLPFSLLYPTQWLTGISCVGLLLHLPSECTSMVQLPLFPSQYLE